MADFPPDVNLNDYPFPIRADLIVHLILPRDLRASEAERLKAFIDTLVIVPADREQKQ